MEAGHTRICRQLLANPHDNAAWADAYQELFPALVRTIRLKTNSLPEAEDAASYAIAELWKNAGVLRAPDRLRAWLYRVASNEAINIRRKRLRAVECERAGDPKLIADTKPDPSIRAELAEEREGLLHALAKLTEPQREIIIMKYYMQMSAKELGVALGCEPGAARKRLCDALAVLRKLLVIPQLGSGAEP